jgi:uncharacterized protein DUF2809
VRRRRVVYGAALVVVVALGLASRKFPGLFPAALGKYPGDALWAIMVFLLWGIARPTISTGKLAALALATSYIDEFSQIYQAAWINSIRATTLGHLILGSAFSWWDMLSYTVGVALAVVCEKAAFRDQN